MNSQLTEAGILADVPPATRRASLVWALGVVAAYLVAGALCGWLWSTRFDSPSGVVYDHTWYPDPWDAGQRTVFSSTSSYVVIALVAGLLLGVVASVVSRGREVVTLLAVVVGAVAAGLLMLWVGHQLAPADPAHAAASAADGTHLDGGIATPGKATWVCLPLASLAALCVVYLTVQPRQEIAVPEQA